jgi:selenide,water dikinase
VLSDGGGFLSAGWRVARRTELDKRFTSYIDGIEETVVVGEPRHDAAAYADMLDSTTQLNTLGAELPAIAGVHAVTDVTGFGLLGHALEMCRGAGLGARMEAERLPWFPAAVRLAEAGFGTGASKRNWASYGPEVDLPAETPTWRRDLLCDPQTSGGLLIACAPEDAPDVIALARARGFAHAADIGAFVAGPARVRI